MATGQTLLDTMEVLDAELEAQTGEPDVARALIALNRAQDLLELLLVAYPGAKGDTTGTVVTAANTETTAFPSGLLRLDRLQFLDSGTSRPAWDIRRLTRVGDHAWSRYWPWNILSTTSPGKPIAYVTNGRLIYWDPLPDAVHTIRWHGLSPATDITAGGTFLYDDFLILPLATLASRLMSMGVGDESADYTQLAESLLGPVLKALYHYDRNIPGNFVYTRGHDT